MQLLEVRPAGLPSITRVGLVPLVAGTRLHACLVELPENEGPSITNACESVAQEALRYLPGQNPCGVRFIEVVLRSCAESSTIDQQVFTFYVGETTTRAYINFWEPVRDQALRQRIYAQCLDALMGADA